MLNRCTIQVLVYSVFGIFYHLDYLYRIVHYIQLYSLGYYKNVSEY